MALDPTRRSRSRPEPTNHPGATVRRVVRRSQDRPNAMRCTPRPTGPVLQGSSPRIGRRQIEPGRATSLTAAMAGAGSSAVTRKPLSGERCRGDTCPGPDLHGRCTSLQPSKFHDVVEEAFRIPRAVPVVLRALAFRNPGATSLCNAPEGGHLSELVSVGKRAAKRSARFPGRHRVLGFSGPQQYVTRGHVLLGT